MKSFSISLRALRMGCAMALLTATSLALAQQAASRSVRPVPQPKAPSVRPGALPNPAGLRSQFPAGLEAAVRRPELARPSGSHARAQGWRAGSTGGALAYGAATGNALYSDGSPPSPSQEAAPGPLTALQIAQSFLGADANRDGELTRAEAQRLTVMPYSFETIDRNFDGILTRFEYEDGVR